MASSVIYKKLQEKFKELGDKGVIPSASNVMGMDAISQALLAKSFMQPQVAERTPIKTEADVDIDIKAEAVIDVDAEEIKPEREGQTPQDDSGKGVTNDKNLTFGEKLGKVLGISPKSETEKKQIEKEKAAEKKRQYKKFKKDLVDGITKPFKAIFTKPLDLFKNNWKKIMLLLGVLFLKPSQMKKVWEALKGLGEWFMNDGIKIITQIGEVLSEYIPKLFDLISPFFKWVGEKIFGKSRKDSFDEENKIVQEKQAIYDNKEYQTNWYGQKETDEEYRARKAKEKIDLDAAKEKRDRFGHVNKDGKFIPNKDTRRQGGLLGESDGIFDSIMDSAPAIGMGLGGLGLAGVGIGGMTKLGLKGAWGATKGVAKLAKNTGRIGLRAIGVGGGQEALKRVARLKANRMTNLVGAGMPFGGVKPTAITPTKIPTQMSLPFNAPKQMSLFSEKAIKETAETTAKAASKTVGKSAAKTIGKSALKKIPILGAVAGLGFAIDRAIDGDWLGATGELASGLMGATGVGMAGSAAIDVALLARDIKNSKEKEDGAKLEKLEQEDETGRKEVIATVASQLEAKSNPQERTNLLQGLHKENQNLKFNGDLKVTEVNDNSVVNNYYGSQGDTVIPLPAETTIKELKPLPKGH